MRRALADVADRVAQGNGLAEMMRRHPRVFGPLELAVVEVGERSGQLADSVMGLSEWCAFRDRLRRVILSGMGLPLVVFHAAALIIPFPQYILGQIGEVEYVLHVAAFLGLLWVPAAIILGVIAFTPKTGILRRGLDELTLHLPLLGSAVRDLSIARYCSAFHMLASAGTPVIQCAETSTDATGNTAVAALLRGGADSARSGSPVSEGFSHKLPREFIEVWEVGEHTGESDLAALRLRDMFAQRAEWVLEQLAKWLPRIIYGIVAVLVIISILRGFIAIYGPVLSL